MANNEVLIVTGASGNLGRLVLQELIAAGQTHVVATTRTPENLADFAAQGVDVRKADFNDAPSLADAFRGGTRLLLISTTDVGTRVPQHGAAIHAARAAGVQHVIYTSWPDAETSVAGVSPDHAATEALVLQSGLKYTFLGNYLYAETLLFSLPAALEHGKLLGSAGDGRAAYVTRQDCAAAASCVLQQGKDHENKRYRISGPQAYSRKEIAAVASEVTGKPLAYVDLPADEFEKALVSTGMPDGFAKLFVSFEQAIQNGELETVSQDVLTLTGRAPESLHSFLKDALK